LTEILTLEEVQRWAAEIKADPTRGAITRGMFRDLCATTLHLAAERDRLRALVAGMRDAGSNLIKKLEEAAQAGDFIMDEAAVVAFRSCLADPDGQRAAEEAAKAREDARQWREMCATTDRMLAEWDATDPMTRLAEEAAAESEELRLLREFEAGYRDLGAGTNARLIHAGAALDAFRARQKGAPK
jgi:hypothetical protein